MIKNIRSFSVKFKKFEELIIDFFIWNGHIHYLSPKLSRIVGYFYIFQNLTQNQACKLTGFSKGNISTSLSDLLESQILNVKMIPGTHTKIYSLEDKNFKLEYDYEYNIKRLRELINLLEKPYGNLYIYRDLEGFDKINNRIQNFMDFIKKQKEFIKDEYASIKIGKTFNPLGNLSKNIVFPSENMVEIKQVEYMSVINPKIIEIEKNIVEEIGKYNIFRIHDPNLNLIFSFFISRRYISQDMLSNLATLSLSTISRAIKALLKKNYIEQKDFRLGGKRIYEIISVNVPKYSYNKLFSQILSIWKSRFIKLKKSLQDPSNNLMDLWEYPYIYTIIDRIIDKL